MPDYYLNTADEQAMQDTLIQLGLASITEALLDEQGEVLEPARLAPVDCIALDVIGTWSERTGGTDEEPVYTQVTGWHFNVRSVEPIDWPESVTAVEPVTPWRVWG